MINLKGVVKKLNLSRFIIHEKLMCVGIRLIISVTFLLLVVSVRLQAQDRKSTRLNSSHTAESRMPSSA